MLDERNNRLSCSSSRPALTTLAAHSGVLGLLRSAGKTAPQIAAALHQAYCAHVERCIFVATHCGLPRLSPAALMSLAAGRPQLQWLGRREGRGPAPRLASFGGRLDRSPGCVFTCTTSQKPVLIPCVEKSGGHLGSRRRARHAGLAVDPQAATMPRRARWPAPAASTPGRGE